MTKAGRQLNLFGKGIARICAVAAASTAAGMARLVRQGLRETPTVELRLDWLRNDIERDRFLAWLRKNRPRRATFLATCRRRAGGGRFPGNLRRELYWLKRAGDAGCSWCDLEIETVRELQDEQSLQDKSLRELGLPGGIMLSLHDFERTPLLGRRSGGRKEAPADALKIAANAQTIGDSVRLLKFVHDARNLVIVPMGEVGLPARVLALREGSQLAYAPIGAATAPGQVSLRDLKHLYRAHQLTSRTQIYGVIGNPVGHSPSPLMHNTAFIARKIDAVYLPFLVNDLRDFLKAIPEFGIRGFSVTIPHKQAILKHLQECDPLAARIGAVNTVIVRRDGALFGCNTDHIGVLRALEKKLMLRGSRVLIYGAGGVARAAAFALSRGEALVFICARRDGASRELARAIGGEVLPRRALRHEKFDVIINATPIGMHPHTGSSPLSPRELNCHVVMDLINRPHKTQLLKLAAGKGLATVSGIEMFIPQGVAQWELWTGRRAPESLMRRVVLNALRSEE